MKDNEATCTSIDSEDFRRVISSEVVDFALPDGGKTLARKYEESVSVWLRSSNSEPRPDPIVFSFGAPVTFDESPIGLFAYKNGFYVKLSEEMDDGCNCLDIEDGKLFRMEWKEIVSPSRGIEAYPDPWDE